MSFFHCGWLKSLYEHRLPHTVFQEILPQSQHSQGFPAVFTVCHFGNNREHLQLGYRIQPRPGVCSEDPIATCLPLLADSFKRLFIKVHLMFIITNYMFTLKIPYYKMNTRSASLVMLTQ